jgi:3',5'-cyclic AMP phosphodiesterase CpdA
MRIVHISDLHLNSYFKRANIKKLKRVLKNAVNIDPDHIVITGDISDDAKESEFILLKKILKTFGLYSSDKVSLVIGNHDIFGGVQTAKDVVDFPAKCSRTNYDQKINFFIDYFKELFEGTITVSGTPEFPYIKIVRDAAFIGINSNDRYSTLKNPFASNGRVYEDQHNKILQLLRNPILKLKHKIVLIHHHFYKKKEPSSSSENNIWDKIETFTMKLRGKKKLIKIFNSYNIKLVLHGHSHEIRNYTRKNIQFYNAGASIDNDLTSAYFNLIEFDSRDFSVSLEEVPAVSKTSIVKPKEELRVLNFAENMTI